MVDPEALSLAVLDGLAHSGIGIENLLERLLEQETDLESKRQARVIFLRLDRVDCLPRNSELPGQFTL